MPKVSVIVPVYNTEKYLRRCMDSLTAQTLRELEIILVDDGSPDSYDTVAAKVSAAPQNPMMRFCFEVYSSAVLNLKLLVCICFQVVLSHTFHD